jgi:hypothetical protein
VDGFRDDYKGHMIFSHCAGPACGPWTCSYTVWDLDARFELRNVLQGVVDGTFQSIKLANEVALEQAKVRIDDLLEQRAIRTSTVNFKPCEVDMNDFRNT